MNRRQFSKSAIALTSLLPVMLELLPETPRSEAEEYFALTGAEYFDWNHCITDVEYSSLTLSFENSEAQL